MSEERPIIFTITYGDLNTYRITTKDVRGKDSIRNAVTSKCILREMIAITAYLNNKGCAVLFEVD